MGLLILYFSAFPIKISTPNPYHIHEKILLSHNPVGELFVLALQYHTNQQNHNTTETILWTLRSGHLLDLNCSWWTEL